jgi:hypothetical protein
MSPCMKYASFLVRFWRLPARNGGEITAPWQSEVEHIQSGKTWSFDTLDELEEFLRQQAIDPGQLEWIEIQENEL